MQTDFPIDHEINQIQRKSSIKGRMSDQYPQSHQINR